MTHGFFKGLLFLDSGSVIHAVHDEQDMRKMGGLRKKIPITYWTMLIGSIAISGIPPLAGFFSKDEILGEAFKNGFLWVWAIGFLVAGMTAFYMFRLIGLTFWGESRVDPAVEPEIHESGRWMTVPLLILAIPTILVGLFLGLPFGASRLQGWLEPVFAPAVALGKPEQPFALFGLDGGLILASVAVASLGIALAWRLFGVELGPLQAKPRPADGQCDRHRQRRDPLPVPRLAQQVVVRRPQRPAVHPDRRPDRLRPVVVRPEHRRRRGQRRPAGSSARPAAGLRRIQTGRVQNYALGIAVGLIVMAAAYLVIAGSK